VASDEWPVKLWRIAAATRDCAADDLRGGGAARYPGRWNKQTEPVIYCAPTRAIAILETAAHIDDSAFPQNRYLVEIAVPDKVWSAREEIPVARLPVSWDAIPAGQVSIKVGSTWLSSRRSPILLVPSVIVPEEWCALINPQHPLAARISAQAVRAFNYQRLFRSGSMPRS
jgi:RES domain-containing protein